MRYSQILAMGAATIAMLSSVPGGAATAPRIGNAQLQQPLPLPYDVSADADAQVAAAMKRAKASHKLLLIDLGGNWCLDCRVLAGVMEVPAVARFIQRHYEVVKVDIGRRDKNLQIPTHYGINLQGVPAVLIIDPRKDKLINEGKIAALADARSMTPQALADWLAQWV
jgi:thiol:disulfide interchange protein